MKTAVQELMDYLNKWDKEGEENFDALLCGTLVKAKLALEKEKEQIMKAVQDACECTYNSCNSGCGGNIEIDFTPQEYYNQVYNQNK